MSQLKNARKYTSKPRNVILGERDKSGSTIEGSSKKIECLDWDVKVRHPSELLEGTLVEGRGRGEGGGESNSIGAIYHILNAVPEGLGFGRNPFLFYFSYLVTFLNSNAIQFINQQVI